MLHDRHTIKVFYLDEKANNWIYLSEHEIEQKEKITSIQAISSSDVLVFIVEVDYRPFIYYYNLDRKNLLLWKKLDYGYENYLFVPDVLLD